MDISGSQVPGTQQCVLCNMTFSSGTALRDHQLTQHRQVINKHELFKWVKKFRVRVACADEYFMVSMKP